jgi:signal transduction histidine kinase
VSPESKTSGDVFTIALGRWFAELSDRGIFTTDDSLIVRTWNPWLEANTGITKDNAIGRPICGLFPSISARGLDQYFRDALGGELRVLSESLHKFLIPIRRHLPSSGLADMAQSARIAPLSLDGPIIGTITVIEDVTERVVSERELRHQIAVSEHARHVAEDASKLKDEFLATLSHEIRTPLNAVLGWARILRTQPNIGSRSRGLEVIERNASSQLRLVEDLLDMARVMGGKLRLDMKAIDLNEIAKAAIDVVEPGPSRRRSPSARNSRDRSMVNGDADRLQQVVWNLMSNAVKFTEPGGRIDVAISRIGDSLELVVHDNGQGISRGFLPFVFDRFRQADGTRAAATADSASTGAGSADRRAARRQGFR